MGRREGIGIAWVVTIPAAALVGAGVYAMMSIDGGSDVGPVIVTALGAVAIYAVMCAARPRTRGGESTPLPPAPAQAVPAPEPTVPARVG